VGLVTGPRGRRAVGGELSGEVPAQREHLRRLVELDEENLSVQAGAAARCEDVSRLLEQRGLRCVALDAPGLVGDVIRSREARDAVRPSLLAIDAEMDHGSVRFGSAAIKDVAGLDAKRLLAGCTTQVTNIERATFRVSPA